MYRILLVLTAGLVGLVVVDRLGRPATVPPQAPRATEVSPISVDPGPQARTVPGGPGSRTDLLLAVPQYESSPAPEPPRTTASPVPLADSQASPIAKSRDPRLQYLTAQALAGRVQPGATPTVLVLYG